MQMLYCKVLLLLRLSKYYDIYTISYFDLNKSINGEFKSVFKKGIYSKNLAVWSLNKIIKQKIDIFGLSKENVSKIIAEAKLLVLKSEALNKDSGLLQTRYLYDKSIFEEKYKDGLGNQNTNIDETMKIISKKLNSPIDPKEISAYKVFQTIEIIRHENEIANKNNKKS